MPGFLSSIRYMFANKTKHTFTKKSDLVMLSPEDILKLHPDEIGFYIESTEGNLSKEQQDALNFVLRLKESTKTIRDKSNKEKIIKTLRDNHIKAGEGKLERQKKFSEDVKNILSEKKKEVEFERRLQALMQREGGKGKTVSKRKQRVKTRKLKKSKNPKKHKRRV